VSAVASVLIEIHAEGVKHLGRILLEAVQLLGRDVAPVQRHNVVIALQAFHIVDFRQSQIRHDCAFSHYAHAAR
jgi:hypothetical protein